MKEKYFILSDWYGNLRRCPAGLQYLKKWEYMQTLTITDGRPVLLMVEATTGQTVVLADTNNNTYKIKLSKIPISDYYEVTPSQRVKRQGKGWINQPLITQPNIKEIWAVT